MSGAKVAIIFGFPGVLVPCGHCFLSIFFPGGFRGRRFSVSPCGSGLFSAEVRLTGNGTALHTVYISCCGRVWYYIQCIFRVADVFGIIYSVYLVLRMCLALHTLYISCYGRVWRYIQCIFRVADVFGITYSVCFASSVGLKEKTDVSVRKTRWEEASNAV